MISTVSFVYVKQSVIFTWGSLRVLDVDPLISLSGDGGLSPQELAPHVPNVHAAHDGAEDEEARTADEEGHLPLAEHDGVVVVAVEGEGRLVASCQVPRPGDLNVRRRGGEGNVHVLVAVVRVVAAADLERGETIGGSM